MLSLRGKQSAALLGSGAGSAKASFLRVRTDRWVWRDAMPAYFCARRILCIRLFCVLGAHAVVASCFCDLTASSCLAYTPVCPGVLLTDSCTACSIMVGLRFRRLVMWLTWTSVCAPRTLLIERGLPRVKSLVSCKLNNLDSPFLRGGNFCGGNPCYRVVPDISFFAPLIPPKFGAYRKLAQRSKVPV